MDAPGILPSGCLSPVAFPIRMDLGDKGSSAPFPAARQPLPSRGWL